MSQGDPGYDELQKQQVLFGKLAVRDGYCSEDELRRCLEKQARLAESNRRQRLGQIMVDEAVLTPEDVREILERQSKRLMVCEGCERRMNVIRFVEGETYQCPSCGEALNPAERDRVDVDRHHAADQRVGDGEKQG